MKRIAAILMLVVMMGCMGPKPKYESVRTVETEVTITNVCNAKYSIVEGYVFYYDIQVPVSNGGTGYYYKTYNLEPGQKVKRKVTIFASTDLEKTYIVADVVDFDDYVVK